MARAERLLMGLSLIGAAVAMMVLEYQRGATIRKPLDGKAFAIWMVYFLLIVLGLSLLGSAIMDSRH